MLTHCVVAGPRPRPRRLPGSSRPRKVRLPGPGGPEDTAGDTAVEFTKNDVSYVAYAGYGRCGGKANEALIMLFGRASPRFCRAKQQHL